MFTSIRNRTALLRLEQRLTDPRCLYVNVRMRYVDETIEVHRVTKVERKREGISLYYYDPERWDRFRVEYKNIKTLALVDYRPEEVAALADHLTTLGFTHHRLRLITDEVHRSDGSVRYYAHTDSLARRWYVDTRCNFQRDGGDHFTIVLHRDRQPDDGDHPQLYKCVYSSHGPFVWAEEFQIEADPEYPRPHQRIESKYGAVLPELLTLQEPKYMNYEELKATLRPGQRTRRTTWDAHFFVEVGGKGELRLVDERVPELSSPWRQSGYDADATDYYVLAPEDAQPDDIIKRFKLSGGIEFQALSANTTYDQVLLCAGLRRKLDVVINGKQPAADFQRCLQHGYIAMIHVRVKELVPPERPSRYAKPTVQEKLLWGFGPRATDALALMTAYLDTNRPLLEPFHD
jgi:hypothetical protein